MEPSEGEDKTFAAMGVAKTLGTVRSTSFLNRLLRSKTIKIIASVDSSPEILAQIQEIIIPILVLTLESKLIGTCEDLVLTCICLIYACKICMTTFTIWWILSPSS